MAILYGSNSKSAPKTTTSSSAPKPTAYQQSLIDKARSGALGGGMQSVATKYTAPALSGGSSSSSSGDSMLGRGGISYLGGTISPVGYGAGGAGGSINGSYGYHGTAGGDGIVIVTEYYA